MMSKGYRNRKKAIRNMRRKFACEPTDILKFYAAEYNDRWEGVAAKLVLKDRGEDAVI